MSLETARMLYEKHSFTAARAEYDLVLSAEPLNTDALNGRARCFYHLHQYELAIEDFQKSLDREPSSATALRGKAWGLYSLGEYADASALFEHVLAHVDDGDVQALRGNGLCKYQLGKYFESLVLFETLVRKEPKDTHGREWRDKARAKAEGPSTQGLSAKAGRSVKAGDKQSCFLFGACLRGKPAEQSQEEAFNVDSKASSVTEQQSSLHIASGSVAVIRARDAPSGEATKDDHLSANVQEEAALQSNLNKGLLKFSRGHYRDAIEEFDQTLRGDPQNQVALLCRAAALTALQEKASALAGIDMAQLATRRSCKVLIIGAGPTGLALALELARAMRAKDFSPATAYIHVLERHDRIEHNHRSRWLRTGRRRDQVVTLQNDVVSLFKDTIDQEETLFAGERVWPRSRNVAISDLEDRLLERVQDDPQLSQYIYLETRDMRNVDMEKMIRAADAEVVIAADGAASPTREAFGSLFNRTPLGNTTKDPEVVECDYALGVGLESRNPGQDQVLNIIFTVMQTRYLLNSEKGTRGYLNIRLTEKEYKALAEATGNEARGCPFGSPITFFTYTAENPTVRKLEKLTPEARWVETVVRDGCKLFGLDYEDVVRDIVGIPLRPGYAQHFWTMLNPTEGGRMAKALCLVGDAAMSHHFWPGRGLNTGLKSVKACALALLSDPSANMSTRLRRYQDFMVKLSEREMHNRSRSMMLRKLKLPPLIDDMFPDGPLQNQIYADAKKQQEALHAMLLQRAIEWRDYLGYQESRSASDEKLSDALQMLTAKDNRLGTVKIIHESGHVVRPIKARDGRRARPQLFGWPIDLQNESDEVFPKVEDFCNRCQ
eukprot:CAMPEP_0178405874 /NCGR_PEP_ID=MMETSP0689_2-20121128/18623_1 /TAXON_ID=160604 /ORGANISM="Amphidinium massartii, Strain CS-259" /LENGTH=834 /DNA_ID=CAMNT_0020026901 /DNA_START=1 /DNA_END=2505 /DNA_ORIENTATION=+